MNLFSKPITTPNTKTWGWSPLETSTHGGDYHSKSQQITAITTRNPKNWWRRPQIEIPTHRRDHHSKCQHTVPITARNANTQSRLPSKFQRSPLQMPAKYQHMVVNTALTTETWSRSPQCRDVEAFNPWMSTRGCDCISQTTALNRYWKCLCVLRDPNITINMYCHLERWIATMCWHVE